MEELHPECASDIYVAELVSKPDNNLASSKIGGKPFLVEGVQIPVCPICSDEMTLVTQIDLTKAPDQFKDDGLFQVFFCKKHSEFEIRTIDIPNSVSYESFGDEGLTDNYCCEECGSKKLTCNK